MHVGLRGRVLLSGVAVLCVILAVFAGMTVYLALYIREYDDDCARGDAGRAVNMMEGLEPITKATETVEAVEALSAGNTSAFMRWATGTFVQRGAAVSEGAPVISCLFVFSSACAPSFQLCFNRSGALAPVPAFFRNGTLSCGNMRPRWAGVVSLADSPAIPLGFVPVVRGSDGANVGYMALGKFLDDFGLNVTLATASACVSMWSPDAPGAMPASARSAASRLRPSWFPQRRHRWLSPDIAVESVRASDLDAEGGLRTCPPHLASTRDHSVAYFTVRSEIRGFEFAPVVFRVDVPQVAMREAVDSIVIAGCVLGGLVLVSYVVGLFILHFYVIRPLVQLLDVVAKLPGALPDAAVLSKMTAALGADAVDEAELAEYSSGGDEIGELGCQLCHLVDMMRTRLERSLRALHVQRQLNEAREMCALALPQCAWASAGLSPALDLLCAPAEAPADRTVQLDQILADPLLVECLKAFGVQNESAENVQFLVDVSLYRQMCELSPSVASDDWDASARDVAAAIAQTYFDPDSASSLNVSAAARSAALRRADASTPGDANAFDLAVREVVHLVATDTVPRFLDTNTVSVGFYAMYRLSASPALALAGSLLARVRAGVHSRNAKATRTFMSGLWSAVTSAGVRSLERKDEDDTSTSASTPKKSVVFSDSRSSESEKL
eukprot:m51a1_g9993 hypothetical protein (670) ;mRNA; r:49683-52028